MAPVGDDVSVPDRRRALTVGLTTWAVPTVLLAVPVKAAAASQQPTFSFVTTNLVWEMPKAVSNFFFARYTLVNDGLGPGKPVVTFSAATERLSLIVDQIDPNWTVSAAAAPYAKTLTWIGPDIPVGGTVVIGGSSALAGYFRGTVANNPPHLGTAREASNFNTAAKVTPSGARGTVFYDGDNYP